LYAPTLTAVEAQLITLPLLTNNPTLYGPTISAATAGSIVLPLLTNAPTLFNPRVFGDGIELLTGWTADLLAARFGTDENVWVAWQKWVLQNGGWSALTTMLGQQATEDLADALNRYWRENDG
jgi:hypothetical protein